MIKKICPCGKEFETYGERLRSGRGKYCSKVCFYQYRKRPSGLKYKLKKVNSGWFKKGNNVNPFPKGYVPWNKGLKGIRLSKHSEFKKGSIPWNKDKKIWKKDWNEYKRLHYWVRKNLGHPHKCEACGSIENIDWANKSQQYLKELDDWISLCRACHLKKDHKYMRENL